MSASAPRHSHTPRARAARENPEGNYNRDRPGQVRRQQCRVWSVTTINYTGEHQRNWKQLKIYFKFQIYLNKVYFKFLKKVFHYILLFPNAKGAHYSPWLQFIFLYVCVLYNQHHFKSISSSFWSAKHLESFHHFASSFCSTTDNCLWWRRHQQYFEIYAASCCM